MSQYKVAVLDDYQGISETKFAKLDPSKFEVTYLPDTLPAYNRSDVSQSVKDDLLNRLKPFQIICPSQCTTFRDSSSRG